MTPLQLFYRFLKQENVFHLFVKNISNNKTRLYCVNDNIKKYFNDTYKRDLIYYAFNWKATNEGHDFWSQINQRWLYKFRTY